MAGGSGSPFGGNSLTIGALNIPFDIESRQLVNETDSQGGVKTSDKWVIVFPQVWGRDNARAFGDMEFGGTLTNKIRHQVTIRYRTGVHQGMRLHVLTGLGGYWYIQTVVDSGGYQRWLDITAEEEEPT